MVGRGISCDKNTNAPTVLTVEAFMCHLSMATLDTEQSAPTCRLRQ